MAADALWYLVAGAACAGFVNGLAGFGTALFALGFWLQVFPPVQAVAMSLAVAIVTGLQGLWVVRRQILGQFRRQIRFLLPAALGVPLGLFALAFVEPRPLKILIAGFLVLYGVFFLTRRSLPKFTRHTPVTDGLVGFVGGILGGLAGLAGVLPAMWCALRPWPRHETRAVLQPFNVTVLAMAASVLAWRGVYDSATLWYLGLALAVAITTAQLGIAVFKRINDIQFRWLLIVLMFLSGSVLMLRELI